jgi:hypothetical protein
MIALTLLVFALAVIAGNCDPSMGMQEETGSHTYTQIIHSCPRKQMHIIINGYYDVQGSIIPSVPGHPVFHIRYPDTLYLHTDDDCNSNVTHCFTLVE